MVENEEWRDGYHGWLDISTHCVGRPPARHCRHWENPNFAKRRPLVHDPEKWLLRLVVWVVPEKRMTAPRVVVPKIDVAIS